MLMRSGSVRKRWAAYFKKLLYARDDREADIVTVGSDIRMQFLRAKKAPSITKENARQAVETMKPGKAPG